MLCAGAGQAAEGVMAIGHRGFIAQAPENTIASFAAAQAAGAAYVEVDVRATRDGVLVLMHDATVDRTTAGRGAVAEMPYATLREWGVVRFREALAWARQAGMRVDVDHKAGDVDAVAAEIRETGMTGRVVIEGSRERLARFAALLPGVDTMPKVRSVAEVAEVCAALRTTVIRLSIEQLAEAGYREAVRRCGARIAVTLLGERDREEEMRRVIGLGAQLIETDHPDLVTRVAPRPAAAVHPLEELIEAARTDSPRLGELLRSGLPGLKARDGAAVWGQEFLFAVESETPAVVSVDKQPPVAMRAVPGTNLWYRLMRLRLGTTHTYTYLTAGRTLGTYDVAGYNPDSYPLPGAARGAMSPMRTIESRVYPGMRANYWVYVNAGADLRAGAPLMVWQDGETLVGNADLLRLRMQIVTDNLVHRRLIPPMVHVLISPGPRIRSIQYDTVSDRYGRYLLDEVLPEVEKSYKLRRDAYSRAIAGASSGAICAWNVAWYFPGQFSRVLSHIGSYTGIQWRPEQQQDGGYIVSHRVRREARKNLRVWLSDGSDDIENETGSWPLNNIQMANALKMKGYDFHFRFGEGSHAIAQGALDLPESLAWLWRGWEAGKTEERYEMEEGERAKPLFRVKIGNREAW
ncbi:MAG: glycerophosphodiester phosphodiesterase family protein [Acidobacteriota bacterium]